jgi:hypothetical protein
MKKHLKYLSKKHWEREKDRYLQLQEKIRKDFQQRQIPLFPEFFRSPEPENVDFRLAARNS